jgi:N12 class adenine-specific DNA methylase
VVAAGEKAKGRDAVAAVRTLLAVEREGRSATPDERGILARFPGFGPVALGLFPDPATGGYRDDGWRTLGEALRSLLTPDEYDSARRTTFTAFYTSPVVMGAIHRAVERLGLPAGATVLEPGCGIGNFMGGGRAGTRFIGVEMDGVSGRIARLLHPDHEIRVENFRDTKLAEGSVDAVVGNVPFADLRLDHRGQRFALHDYFLCKSVDALRPGGVLAAVTSRFTLDKQNGAARQYLADRADLIGAVRLPSDAFKREGTSVVTDVLFLRKRSPGEPARHADPEWLRASPLAIDGAEVPVNQYFLNHPESVLGQWTRKDTLYGTDGLSVAANGDLAQQLAEAIERLPKIELTAASVVASPVPARVFVPPPLDRHVGEGSLFVGDDRIIHQVQDGRGVPVVYGGVTLRANDTQVGRRVAALVGLRDHARRVLRSQNEGWPQGARDAARRELNRAYDGFVLAHGAVNRTTFSHSADGTVIRRMPNLAKFRDDPDAMLVLSLEEYDEVTGKAAKAPILLRDVVGPTPPVTSVGSAEEGLLVSLNTRGMVDLPLISRLYAKPEPDVVQELGDLIYLDPVTQHWQTADDYLSGNVRDKLAAAERAGAEYTRNASALAAVQPEDVPPGDIDANLGAPWIPVADVTAFAADLFRVDPARVPVAHFEKDAVWTFEPGYEAKASVAAASAFGTARANGTALLELALNMKTPTIYDVVQDGDREVRVVNPDETLAAREKQKLIKERFRGWVFADPDRAERLVRTYNDTYNNLRPRAFDGSHLDFPGMTAALELRPHQKDAVWRQMSAGNTLLAHAVGAGKTFTMAAAGMKMRQAGLLKKPMYVVPNHLLEQFAREFMQLYPNARLLVAGKDDLTRDRRKLLTAKIASGDWDGIIVTHSGFERIGMSRGYQESFLREQIAEYDALLAEHAAAKGENRNLIKTIEKQKAARAERLNELLAREKKDDGLVFDELGVDHVFIDEAHAFKNLETPTKMERVAGVQTGGSERAFDVLMKARYLGGLHAGHGVTFATGTPISNTMVELYTLQRFLDPEGLRRRGIEHFDAWAATFGEVVEQMEIAPDGGSLRPRSRFAKFTNLPELQQMFRSFADVQTADMLDLPRPRLRGGKPAVVVCPMSEEQQHLQERLVARYERLRNQRVDPREDNALAITTDGRKLATDARLLVPDAPDFAGSKVNRLVENVVQIWHDSSATRGTQMVFCDLGVNPTPWGYSVYDDVVAKLAAAGIPPEQLAVVGDAATDAKKQVLFERVRNGSVRVLLGSTAKMGTGTNVQRRLVALHHLDAPWKPAEVEQRDGRILRQGNQSAEVAVFRYVTEGSFDAFMWQALETKARFIAQVVTGKNVTRRAEDVGGQELSYAEVKAIASGNPAVLTLAEADAELQRLNILRRNHLDEQFAARRAVRDLPRALEAKAEYLAELSADRVTADSHENDPITIAGEQCAPKEAVAVLGDRLDAVPVHVGHSTNLPLGTFRGLAFGLVLRPGLSSDVYLTGRTTRHAMLSRDHPGPRAVLNGLDRLAQEYGPEAARVRQDITIAEAQLRDHQARLGQPFAHEAYLAELTGLRDQLRDGLAGTPPPKDGADRPTVAALAERIGAVRGAHVVAATPERAERRATVAEEPVVARIRRRTGRVAPAEVPPDPPSAVSPSPVWGRITLDAQPSPGGPGRHR